MAPYIVGDRTFRTKGEATEEVRRVLWRWKEKPGRLLDGEDHALVAAWFWKRPDADEKVGSRGIKGFVVRINSFNGSLDPGFHVVHSDDSTTPWSYKGKKAPNLRNAARQAIAGGQVGVKRAAFAALEVIACPHCRACTTWSGAEVHHLEPKFQDILASFVKKHGKLEVVAAKNLGDDFTDPAVRKLFVEYHDSVAHRIVVCASCNAAEG